MGFNSPMSLIQTPDLQLSGTEYRKSEHTNRFRVAKSLRMHQLRSKSDKINRRTGPRKNTLSLWEKNFSNVPLLAPPAYIQPSTASSGVKCFPTENFIIWTRLGTERSCTAHFSFCNRAVGQCVIAAIPDDSGKSALIREKQMDLCRDFDVFKASWLLRFDMYHWIGLYGLLDDQKWCLFWQHHKFTHNLSGGYRVFVLVACQWQVATSLVEIADRSHVRCAFVVLPRTLSVGQPVVISLFSCALLFYPSLVHHHAGPPPHPP